MLRSTGLVQGKLKLFEREKLHLGTTITKVQLPRF